MFVGQRWIQAHVTIQFLKFSTTQQLINVNASLIVAVLVDLIASPTIMSANPFADHKQVGVINLNSFWLHKNWVYQIIFFRLNLFWLFVLKFTKYLCFCLMHCLVLLDPCNQEPDPGNCLGEFIKWYYSLQDDECRKFSYGGCNGNENRYEITYRNLCNSYNVKNILTSLVVSTKTTYINTPNSFKCPNTQSFEFQWR